MEVSLPVASLGSASSSEPVNIVVMKNGYVVDENRMGEPELEEELARLGSMANPPVLSIRADADTRYQNVVRLLDLLKQHKLQKINLVTRQESD